VTSRASLLLVLFAFASLTTGAFGSAQAPQPETEAVWSCPLHAVVSEKAAGKCPICRRDLVPVTATVTWTCADHPEIDRPAPGKCPDGSAMEKRYVQSTHANHNPQHGGLFFMAPDMWHHLEGAYSQDEMLRVYLYNDYTKPLPPELARQVAGRVVLKETFDPATRTTKEIAAFPLVRAGRGYLEARVDTASLPAQLTAKVRFKDDAPEYRFDFTFSELSKKPAPPPSVAAPDQSAGRSRTAAPGARSDRTPASAATRPAAAAAPPAATSDAAPPASAAGPPADPPAVVIPDSVPEILAQLKTRHREIGELVERGAFGAVWVPAFQARYLSIALEARLNELPAAAREAGEPAIKRLVRTAWLLDAFGDVGNRQQIVDAYAVFGAAVDEVVAAFK